MTTAPRRPRLRSVLIANRGEIALRIVRTVRAAGLRAIVAASDADLESLAARLADDVARLGPPPPRESYLDAERIIEAARRHGADAIHPGYGFLAEDAKFAARVEEAGLVYLGPTPDQIARLGDKLEARRTVAKAGIGPVPGANRAIEGRDDLARIERELGFPLVFKASGGGGGRGIRIARESHELEKLFELATSEAKDAGADGRVFAERYIERGRHVEVQVLGDGRGGGLVFPERDCSIQRRLQKLVEETPAPNLPQAIRDKLARTAFEVLRSTSYRGPGTLEFLVDPEGEACFLEMNTRIQVEHPVTEMICGIDIVLEQLEIAQGATLPSTFDEARRAACGHAIEARVNAEDVLRDFQPATGRIARIDLPGGPGVRVDAGIAAGDEVLPYYDTLLAKVIAHGDDRKQALARLLVACEGMRIFGVTTTLPFTRALLATPTFATGAYHCQSVAELLRTSGFVRASVKDDGSLARLAAAAAFLASRERKRASERDRASVPRAEWSRDLGGAPGWE